MSRTRPTSEFAPAPHIELGRSRLCISIPLATSQSTKLHLTALLVIWALGAAFAAVSLFLDSRLLGPAIAHVLWIAAGIPVLWAYTRFAAGREIILFRNNTMTIAHRPFPLSFKRKYHLAQAKHFRIDTIGLRLTDWRHRRNPIRWRGEQGMILFDYNLKPVRFGAALDSAGARHILQVMQESGHVSPHQIDSSPD